MILKKARLCPSIKSIFAIVFVVAQVVSAGPAVWTIYTVSPSSRTAFIEPRSTEVNTPEALIALIDAPKIAESRAATEFLIIKNDFFSCSEPQSAAKKSGKGKSSSDTLSTCISNRLESLYEDHTAAHFRSLLPEFITNFSKRLYGIRPESTIISCESPLFDQIRAFKISILDRERIKIFIYLEFNPSSDVTFENRLKFGTQISSLFPTSCSAMLKQTEANMMSIIELINKGRPSAASETVTASAASAAAGGGGKLSKHAKKKKAAAKAAASSEISPPSAAVAVDSDTIAAALIAEQEAENRKEAEALELARQKEEERKQKLLEAQEAAARAKAEEEKKKQDAELERQRLQSIKDREAAEARRLELRAAQLQAKKEAKEAEERKRKEAELEHKRKEAEILAQRKEQERQRQLALAAQAKAEKQQAAKELKAREHEAERARKLQEQQARERLLLEEQQRAEAIKEKQRREQALKEQREKVLKDQRDRAFKEQLECASRQKEEQERRRIARLQQEDEERRRAARLQQEEEERQLAARLQQQEERQLADRLRAEEQEREAMLDRLQAVRLERARLAEDLQIQEAALARERSRSTASIPRYAGFDHSSPTSSVTSQDYSPYTSPDAQNNSFYRPPPPGFAAVAPTHFNQPPQQQYQQQFSPMGNMLEQRQQQQQYPHFPSPQSYGSNGSSSVAHSPGYAQRVVPPQAVASPASSYYSPFGGIDHQSPYSGGALGSGLQIDTSSGYQRPRGSSIFDQDPMSSQHSGSSAPRISFPGLFASPQSTSRVVGGPVSGSRRIVEPIAEPTAAVTHASPFGYSGSLNGLDLNEILSDPPSLDLTGLYPQQQQQRQEGPPPSESDRLNRWF